MLKWLWMASCILANINYALAEDASVDQQYSEIKNQIVVNDRVSREFMANLYEINNRMKSISKKRSLLSNRMIDAEANVKTLANTTSKLEKAVGKQREALSKRMRTLYMLGEDKFLRAIFSANNSEDLQQMLKYLKIFSERDYHLLKSYESNLDILSVKRDKLEKNVASLIAIKKRLETQEKKLIEDQEAKSKFISKLSNQRKAALRKLAKIKGNASTDLFDISFFEKKGKLQRPFLGSLAQGYGMIENPEYKYRLSHKGHLYQSQGPKSVRAIFDGSVVFSGEIEGYGKTTVIDHGDHYYTVYAGLNNPRVTKGERVAERDVVSTGDREIYFELRHFSDAIDPTDWIKR